MDMKASVTRRTGSNNAAAAVDRSSRIEVGHTRLPVGHSLLLKAEAPRPIEAAGQFRRNYFALPELLHSACTPL